MIRTSRQLKALVRNLSKGDSTKAQIIIRNYVMERFLERLSISQYRDNLILKGGILVAAMVGLDNRSTLDVDATVKNLQLTEDSVNKFVNDIINITIDDGMTFEIMNVVNILDESEYPGIRVTIDASLETMKTPLKIDFSTDDVITPNEISYSYGLLFEDRAISILAYNLETILAEKLETLIARGTANTRMRDFYDLYILDNTQSSNINDDILKTAFINTSTKRGSNALLTDVYIILVEVENSDDMMMLWENYKRKFDYATEVSWESVMQSVRKLFRIVT